MSDLARPARPNDFTAAAVGVRLLRPGSVDPFYEHRPLRVVRVVHEHEVRRGTFLGFGVDPDGWLQRCGMFYPAAAAGKTVDFVGAGERPPTADGTAGALTYAHTGSAWQPAVPDDRLGFGWLLIRVEYDYSLSGPSDDCTLMYADLRDHRRTRRISVPTSTPMDLVATGKTGPR